MMPEIATRRRGLTMLLTCLIATSTVLAPVAAAAPERATISYAAPALTALPSGQGVGPSGAESDLLAQQDPQATVSARPDPQGGKSPVLATLLSVLMAGGGQFYNGDWIKGVIQMGGTLGLLGVVVGAAGASLGGNRSAETWGWAALAGVGALKLWSMIDAPLAAVTINARLEEQQRLSFGYSVGPRGLLVSTALRF